MNIFKNNFLFQNIEIINVNKSLIILIYIFIYIYIYHPKYKSSYIQINNKAFAKEIQKSYLSNNKVNINKLEQEFYKNNSLDNKISNNPKFTLNIGFTLDSNYILQTMMTVASIIVTQNKSCKIRFHFGVTRDFRAVHMLKLYGLKNRLNNLTEFNFYYLKGANKKMKNFHPKGEACPGKFELPQLLPDDVKRLLLFDAGDVLVLRDLLELYNYDMKDYWVLGPPEPRCIMFVRRLNLTKYINIGSILINVEELKNNHFWDLYVKNKDVKKGGMPDQTLLNLLIPDDKKNFFPFRFGLPSIISSDENSDKLIFIDFHFKSWLNSTLSNHLPEKPKSEIEILAQTYNPLFIHQYNEKWSKGKGLSIYRHLCKYFIDQAGIRNEICLIEPGYCL